ncbi:type A chloramphenicol O-acetyltransferase [Clostridium sp. CS001]|uniref:type A chloramphenicol O-acetyltransferase n=1 Tax=Clostridium sp. CS001 TaxID=2880648 RepID=UPI001CF47F08|nr:type A chloramphenicol O-acetyltransferase [Clostridium sp. CS001]MCB2291907.1 type A chloramphenicol O-acetyltransferase [Clostridium sp. CS001]
MNFKLIEKEKWQRKEIFEHYFSTVPCTYSMTVKLDITKIKEANQKLYPKMLYLLSKVINNHSEFRTALNNNGKLGVFDELSPCYTVFHKDTETFSNIWTEYFADYETFYGEYQKDIKEFGSMKRMEAKPNTPNNTFSVSMIPWETFEGFNLNLQKGYDYLLPIFTIGKYYKENDKYILPLAIQVHHSVCDGFHVCRFINELKTLIAI